MFITCPWPRDIRLCLEVARAVLPHALCFVADQFGQFFAAKAGGRLSGERS
jgi:hypothetical protein